jgi:hypothetical protein
MSMESRYDKTADVEPVTEVDDGYGGVKQTPVTAASAYRFTLFPPSPFSRQALITELGLSADADLKKGAGEPRGLSQGCKLNVSDDEIWQVLAVDPQRSLSGTVDHFAFVALRER